MLIGTEVTEPTGTRAIENLQGQGCLREHSVIGHWREEQARTAWRNLQETPNLQWSIMKYWQGGIGDGQFHELGVSDDGGNENKDCLLVFYQWSPEVEPWVFRWTFSPSAHLQIGRGLQYCRPLVLC